MILELLQNPIFMYAFTLSIIMFVILYIWRKIIAVESNFYILEKRINNIKKASINSNNDNDMYMPNIMNENIRAADLIMSEVFNNIESDKQLCPNMPNVVEHHKEKKSKKTHHNETSTVHNVDVVTSENVAHSEKTNNISFIELINTPIVKHAHDEINNEHFLTSFLQKNKNDTVTAHDINKSDKKEPPNNIIPNDINNDIHNDITIKDLNEKISIHSDEDNLEKDTTKSEIMSTIKLTGRKLLKHDLGKLKEYCSVLNVSSEGTKTQIIDRLLLL